MPRSELSTQPKTFVLVDPTSPDGESALSQLDERDDHVALVVLLGGPSAEALRAFAAAEEIDLPIAGGIYLDQVADRIQTDDRLVEVVTVPGPDARAELHDLVTANSTRRVLLPDSATDRSKQRRRPWHTRVRAA